MAQRGGEVDRPARLSIPMARLRKAAMTWGCVGAQLRGVLGEGHVADVVQAVLDRPVSPDEVGEAAGRALAKVRLMIASTTTVRHLRVCRSWSFRVINRI